MSDAKNTGRNKRDDEETAPTAEILASLKRPGSRIGQFIVEREIGRGGMGVVYLARDTKLDRRVAVKSLPREIMDNPQVRSRLSREAKLLASLNHPNIATIHDIVEEEDGSPFIVLEYVPGETLAEKIADTKLKLQEALPIARQIAEATAAAHEHNVVHRDLKPANIKITPDGRIKVLDFGLAKTVRGPEVDQDSSVTRKGRIVGTPEYMSPEQARGLQTDERSDIWSFGCVLYKMLTGKAPFVGDTVSDTIAAILDREPDWNTLPPATPANIRILLRRCLEKDPRRRLHDIADAAIEISETLSGTLEVFAVPDNVAPASRLLRCNVILVGLACLIAGALVAGAVLFCRLRPVAVKTPAVSRLVIPLPADKPLYTGTAPNRFLAISPDGTRLVYVGDAGDRNTKLYVRPLDSLQIEPIPGTRGAHNPFFSPNGQWVGFFTETELKKVSLSAGDPLPVHKDIQLGDVAFGSWADDGTIVVSLRSGEHVLQRVHDSADRQAETLVQRTPEDKGIHYCYPQVLPGGDAILYSRVDSNALSASSIEAFLTKTNKQQTVLDKASYATYVNSGHLIFVRGNVLMAAPFDVEKLRITGPVALLAKDNVEFDWTDQTPQITISENGTVAYVSGSACRKGQLVWVDRSGNDEPLVTETACYEGLRLSSDGQLVAVAIRSPTEGSIKVNVYNVQRGTFTPLTTRGESDYPQWSPDGKRVAFWGLEHGTGQPAMFCRVPGATAAPEWLATKPSAGIFLHPYSWSRNLLACTVLDPKNREDIWILDVDGDRKPRLVIGTENREYNPTFSPDGCWLAYVSEESGQAQIYLREYPDAGRRWIVPTRDATNPAWSRDGRELYYISGKRMMAVKVTSEQDFPIGAPELLFESSELIVSGGSLRRNYDVSEDGRFLMVKWIEDAQCQLIVVQNWFEELKRLSPPPKER